MQKILFASIVAPKFYIDHVRTGFAKHLDRQTIVRESHDTVFDISVD
jgi:hypothetical protein